MSTDSSASTQVITPEALLNHWQGHRRLTRRVIEAFPEDQLSTFSLAGMRTFGDMAMEMLAIAVPMVRGVLARNGIPRSTARPSPRTRSSASGTPRLRS